MAKPKMTMAPTRSKAMVKPKAPPRQAKGKESLGQFKTRIGKMNRDELLDEAEDLLADEPV